jgi:uncharacterized surface protein with fasciclin (FAS1) repeats
MYYLYKRRSLLFNVTWIAIIISVMSGCTKVAPIYALQKPDVSPDTANDIRVALNSIPNCTLFTQAFKRAGMPDQVDPGTFYTIFAPSDSAMKVAGLTADVINTLPLDSLQKIVKYHITYGAVSDTALENAVVCTRQSCLLDSNFFNINTGYRRYIHSLYVKIYGGKLSINGWFVNNGGVPVKSSNGYIYTINIVLLPPSQLLWNIIKGRPELSYYFAAINIMDSIYYAKGFSSSVLMGFDSAVFNQVKFDGITGSWDGMNASPTNVIPTVFAPTNTAFINAGLPDINSVRNLIIGSMVTNVSLNFPEYPWATYSIPGTTYVLSGGSLNSTACYFPLDSIFKMHCLFNADPAGGYGTTGTAYGNLISYTDLTGCPNINNGVFNKSVLNSDNGYSATCITPYTLQFSSSGGLVNIQWNSAGSNNAVIYSDANQLSGNRNFWALNGVIYESDQLFYNK